MKESGADVGDFLISSVFSSPYYIGSEELHLPVPFVLPEDAPSWVPEIVSKSSFQLVENAVRTGVVRKASSEARFSIKYGLLRGKADLQPPTDQALSPAEEAGAELANINPTERARRTRVGTVISAASAAATCLADAAGAPLSARLALALPLVLGWGYLESGRTGL